MPSSGRAARVQPVHCPCVAAPPLLFSLTPSLARLAPSSALLPQVQCVVNLPVCAFARAPGHARNTSAGAPDPLPLSPPGRIRGKLSHGCSPPRGALSQLRSARACALIPVPLRARYSPAAPPPCACLCMPAATVPLRILCPQNHARRPPRCSCASSRVLRLLLSLEHDQGAPPASAIPRELAHMR
jgi:hypothetical protein